MTKHIVVVGQNSDITVYLKEFLLENNIKITSFDDDRSALEHISQFVPDLVILDLHVMKSALLCQKIYTVNPDLQTIILTENNGTFTRPQTSDLEADDYIVKPFATQDLISKINNRLNRTSNSGTNLSVDTLSLNTQTQEVKRNGISVKLTPKEFRLLEYLMRNQGRVLSREMILNRIWLYSPDIETRVVDVYMGYLRKKIDGGDNKRLIYSVRGLGYMIKDPKLTDSPSFPNSTQ